MRKIVLVIVSCLMMIALLCGFTTTGDMGPVLQMEKHDLIDIRKNSPQEAYLPTFDITINGQKIENDHAEYPFLIYKDIAYIPLTYDMNRFIGATLYFYQTRHSYEERVYVGRAEIESRHYQPALCQESNPRKVRIQPLDKPLQINNLGANNGLSYMTIDPPPFVYQDVIYLPLTWAIAVEEFGWQMSWDNRNGLKVDTTDPTRPIVFVPSDIDQFAPWNYLERNPYEYACAETTYVGIKNKDVNPALNREVVIKEKGQVLREISIEEYGAVWLYHGLKEVGDEQITKGQVYPQLEKSKFTFIGVNVFSEDSMAMKKDNLYLVTLDIVTEGVTAKKLF